MQFSRDKVKGQRISPYTYPEHAKRDIILWYIIWYLFIIFFHMNFLYSPD